MANSLLNHKLSTIAHTFYELIHHRTPTDEEANTFLFGYVSALHQHAQYGSKIRFLRGDRVDVITHHTQEAGILGTVVHIYPHGLIRIKLDNGMFTETYAPFITNLTDQSNESSK